MNKTMVPVERAPRGERVAIVGSRKFGRLDLVRKYVENLPADAIVVSGGALGVDDAAEIAAEGRGLKTLIYKPAYHVYGKRAPLERNALIVGASDRVVAFHDGTSTGTLHAISIARKTGKPVEVITEKTSKGTP